MQTILSGVPVFPEKELHLSAESETALQKLRENPSKPEGYMELGLCFRRQMCFQEAVRAYSAGLAHDPLFSLLYRHRGHAYINLGLYTLAIADLELALHLAPENWDIWYHLGLAYYLAGDYERAAAVYDGCYTRSYSDNTKICTTDWMCLTLMKLGRLEEMRRWAARISPDMDPGNAKEYFSRVLVYNGTLNADSVLASLRDTRDHVFATGAYGLAVYFDCVLGQHEKAVRIMKQIAEQNETWSGFAEHAAAEDLKNQERMPSGPDMLPYFYKSKERKGLQ